MFGCLSHPALNSLIFPGITRGFGVRNSYSCVYLVMGVILLFALWVDWGMNGRHPALVGSRQLIRIAIEPITFSRTIIVAPPPERHIYSYQTVGSLTI